jgi:hypothetical protein
MSVDYLLFLREEPALDDYVGRYQLCRDETEFVLGGMRLWKQSYEPGADALAGHPWRGEIKWVVGAGGRLDDETYNDFDDLMAELGVRHRGGLWCDHDPEIHWYELGHDAETDEQLIEPDSSPDGIPVRTAHDPLWVPSEVSTTTADDLRERRRRAGEIFAGLPDDIRDLTDDGQWDAAYVAYAQRYGLPLEKAREIVNMNA